MSYDAEYCKCRKRREGKEGNDTAGLPGVEMFTYLLPSLASVWTAGAESYIKGGYVSVSTVALYVVTFEDQTRQRNHSNQPFIAAASRLRSRRGVMGFQRKEGQRHRRNKDKTRSHEGRRERQDGGHRTGAKGGSPTPPSSWQEEVLGKAMGVHMPRSCHDQISGRALGTLEFSHPQAAAETSDIARSPLPGCYIQYKPHAPRFI